MFTKCSDLNEVRKDIESLFRIKGIKLSQKSKDEITFHIMAYNIS